MLKFLTFIIAAICIAPLVYILSSWVHPLSVESFQTWLHVKENLIYQYSLDTIYLCLGVAAVSGLFGVLTAWFTTQYEFSAKKYVTIFLILPVAVPAYITAYAYGWLFDYAGLIQTFLREVTGWQKNDYYFPQFRSLWGAILTIGIATTPYVFMLARSAFLSQPAEWRIVASTLGCTRTQFFLRVALPAAKSFIISGLFLAVMEALADIGTVHILGVQTLSVGIYRSWFYLGEPQIASKIASMLLVIAVVLVVLQAFVRRQQRFDSLRAVNDISLIQLRGLKNIGVSFFCWTPVVLGFLIPVLVLIRLAFYANFKTSLNLIWNTMFDTLSMGFAASIFVTLVALVVVVGARFINEKKYQFIIYLSGLGYAIPGAILALGLLMFFSDLQKLLFSDLVIIGSYIGLIIGYMVRFMAVSYNSLYNGYLRISHEFDWVAFSLKKSNLQTFILVHWPMLRLSFLGAILLVFLDIIKELPATLILRPYDFKNLALITYEYASDDRYIESAPFALVLIFICLLLVGCLLKLQKVDNKNIY